MKSPDKHVTQPTHQSQPAANTTNTRVEEMLVNSLLTDETAISEVAAWFTPEMFTNPDMAFIYRAILAQYQRGERADMLTTEAEMQRLDAAHFQKINGLAILSDSLPHLRHAGNVVKYALLVKEYYLKCSLNTLCLLFAGKALAPPNSRRPK